MKTGIFIISAVLTAACALIAVYFMRACHEKSYKRAAVLKTLAGLCFVLIGLMMAATVSTDKHFAWPVAAGLVLGLLGDALLAVRFIKPEQHDLYFVTGALSFAFGHGLYIFALLTKYDISLAVALSFGIVALAAVACYIMGKKADAGRLMIFGGVYITLVVGMGAVAIGAATAAPCISTLLFAVGGLMFPISDSVLSAYSFGPDNRFSLNITIHATYYLAQLCIAWSLGWA